MTGIAQDLRYALRQLRKSPGFALAVVLTLAIGIGANTAIFGLIEAVLLRPLPYQNPKRLVLLQDAEDPENGGFLLKDITPLKSQVASFADIAFYYRDSGFSNVTIADNDEPQSVQGAFVSSNLFSVMGVSPFLGHAFAAGEEARQERVVILSYGLWTRRFGASLDAVGKELSIGGLNFRVIGVMPKTFQFPAGDQQFWAPMTTNRFWGDPTLSHPDPSHARYAYELWQAVARLKPDASVVQAQAEINTIFTRLSQADPDPNRGSGLTLTPLHVVLSGSTRRGLMVLFYAVLFVLLIACSNVANLVLARATARAREIALRAALGAGRGRIVRQLLTEGTVLALLGGGVGLLLAWWGIRFLSALAPPEIPRIEQAGISAGVLAFTLVSSLASATAFSFLPAWNVSRQDPDGSLKGGVLGGKRWRTRIRSALVIAELSVAVVLLAGAGLLIRSLRALTAVDPGFHPDHVLTMSIEVPSATPISRLALYDGVLERVRNLPEVNAVGEVDALFEPGSVSNLGLRAIQGRPPEPKQRWTPLSWAAVRGDFFQAMGAPLLRGRYFNNGDGVRSTLVAIIDESMGRRYWPNEDPIGRRFKGQDARGQNDDWLTVVGVVRDMRRSGLERNPIPHVYEPAAQAIDGDRTPYLVVRTLGDPGSVAGQLRNSVRGLSNTAILSGVTTLEQELSSQLSPRRFQASLLGAFSAIALGLATLGITALMHFSVAQRTQEIGIRTCLGARRSDILRLVLSEAAKLAICGIVAGLCAAIVATRFMSSLLYEIRPNDPTTLIGACFLLVIAALLASWLPARRAARVDPMVALRCE